MKKNVGVLEGLSGIALLQFYYAKFANEDFVLDWGQETLMLVMKMINEGYGVPTFASGIAGSAWVFEHLSSTNFIEILIIISTLFGNLESFS